MHPVRQNERNAIGKLARQLRSTQARPALQP
jgi:hypothetical protein